MNEEMMKLLRDPEFLEQAAREYEAKLAAEKKARNDFMHSETFSKMLTALRDNPNQLSVSWEEAGYFLADVKARVGWDFATREDVDRFFSILSRSRADTVEEGSYEEDDDCAFEACSFRHYGLTVSLMFGQGTAVRISNVRKPA